MGKKEEGRKWLERLSLKNMESAVLNGSPKIHWEDKEHFWYLKEAYDENGDKVNYRAAITIFVVFFVVFIFSSCYCS